MYSTCYSCKTLIKFHFLDRFLKNIQISNVTKMHPVGAELLHTDKWTRGQDKANSRLSQFYDGA